jgi:hypothetical protein
MKPAYTGRCACSQVTLSISADPVATRQCWCRQCQRIAAGGPSHNAIFSADNVTIDGALASFDWAAASGNILTCYFCAACGTHIYAQSSARPHLKTVRFGVIDEPNGLKPDAIIWTEDAPDWAMLDPALIQWPQQPPAPPPVS